MTMNVEGKGLPHFDDSNRYGLLFVEFILDYPKALEDAQKKSFVDLWTTHHEAAPVEEVIDETVILKEFVEDTHVHARAEGR